MSASAIRKHVTFSNVIALIALFVALGGSVYAASKLNGKQIKKSSVPGNRLKPDSVGGKQVNESKLGTVPSAGFADSAASAGDAATLGGNGPGAFVSSADVRRVHWDVTAASSLISATVLDLAPLELTAGCNQSHFDLEVSSTATSGTFSVGVVKGSTPQTFGGPIGSSPVVVFSDNFSTPSTSRFVGTLVYDDADTTISVPFALFNSSNGVPQGGTRCLFTGTATRTTG